MYAYYLATVYLLWKEQYGGKQATGNNKDFVQKVNKYVINQDINTQAQFFSRKNLTLHFCRQVQQVLFLSKYILPIQYYKTPGFSDLATVL